MSKIKLAPYDEDDNLLRRGTPEANWLANEPFVATLEPTPSAGARSYILFRDVQTGKLYPISNSDYAHLHKNVPITPGAPFRWYATWAVVKRGQSFGLRYLGRALGSPMDYRRREGGQL